jgi:hypothetical protein
MTADESPTTAQRDALVEHVGNTMQVFTARAVLFQDAVAKTAGLNSTDVQLTNLLMLFGPATPGNSRSDPGLLQAGPLRLPSTGWSRPESSSDPEIRMTAGGSS